MTKEQARELLENYLSDQINEGIKINLPIEDEILYDGASFEITRVREMWTFKGLICLVYDLTPSTN